MTFSHRDIEQPEQPLRFDATIPARVSAIDDAMDRIMTAMREAGCVGGIESDIDLAVREAIANAVKHGSQEDPRKTVKISMACDEGGGVLVTVRDSGDGFDPAATRDPATDEGLAAPNGRGLFLIRQLMDEVEFAAGGTEIRMRKLSAG